jgi:hypothetical protein
MAGSRTWNRHGTIAGQIGWILSVAAVISVTGCQPTPEIEGLVTNGLTNSPVEGAMITISGTTLAAATDATGHYRVAFVPGQFRVTATKDGYFESSMSLSVTQAAKIPAQPLVLFPRVASEGLYAAVGGDLYPLQPAAVKMTGNLMGSISGIKEVSNETNLTRDMRILRHPPSPEAPRLVTLHYQEMGEVQGLFGAQRTSVDMWVEKGTVRVDVRNLAPNSFDEIVLPSDLPDGVYAFGSATSASNPIAASIAPSAMWPFILGDPDRTGAGGFDLSAPEHGEVVESEWKDPEDFAVAERIRMPEIGNEEFAILCTQPQGSGGIRRCRVDRLSSGDTVLGPLPESSASLYPISSQNAFAFARYLLRDECSACPHHYQFDVHRWNPSAGKFVLGSRYVSARRYVRGGKTGGLTRVPTTLDGMRKLDEQSAFRDLRFDTSLRSVQGLVPESEFKEVGERCFTREEEDLKFAGATAEKIRYCFFEDQLISVDISFKLLEGRQALSELELTYGAGVESGRPEEDRWWHGNRMYMVYTEGKEFADLWIASRGGVQKRDARKATPEESTSGS